MGSKLLAVNSYVASSNPASRLVDMLREIGGPGKFAEVDWRIRRALNWHTKPKSVVRHLLKFERRPSLEEAAQIEAAYARHCAETIQRNKAENAELVGSIIKFAEHAQRSDPEYYRPHLEALRETLLQLGCDPSSVGE